MKQIKYNQISMMSLALFILVLTKHIKGLSCRLNESKGLFYIIWHVVDVFTPSYRVP